MGCSLILEPVSNRYSIAYPTQATEFEIQAFLYSALMARGVDVRGEVAHRIRRDDQTGRRRACRFDLVVFSDGVATCIIEMKAAPINHRTSVRETRQGRRYVEYGVPVHFVYGMDEARLFLESFGI